MLAISLMAVVWAGCLTGAGTSIQANEPVPSEEAPSSVTVTAAPGVVTAINKGVILGRVVDDAEIRVPGARVSLLETDLFMDTDENGEFRFENVTPRSYVLRTEATGYGAGEQTVEVRAGNVTEASVVLLPLEERGAGYRGHSHDFWGDTTEHLLLETDLEYTGPISAGNENPYVDRVLGMAYYSNQPSPSNSWCKIPFKDMGDGPEIVLPGTKEARVTITWQNPQGSTLEKMGLGYTTAISGTFVHLTKQAPGTPFVIPVKPEEADSGHQRYSLWNFYLEPQNSVANAPADKPAVSPGTFHVKIVLVKAEGPLPVDPPHENRWGTNTTLTVRQRDPGLTASLNSRPTIRLTGGNIVPPGTATLRVAFWWAYTDAANNTPPDRDYVLTWRTADMPPQTTAPQFVTRAPATTASHFKLYEIPLKPTETDGFYQKISTWAFFPSVAGYEKEWYNPDPRARVFNVQIDAIRDPNFE